MSQYELWQCAICETPLTNPLRYGGRTYCATHHAAFYQDAPDFWKNCGIAAGIILMTIVALGILGALAPQSAAQQIRLGAIVAATTAAPLAWTALMYRSSRLKRIETSPLMPAFVVIGALFAAAVTYPVSSAVLNLELWLSRATATNRLLADVLLNGFFHFLVQYLMLRYLAWHPTFSYRTQGVMFGLFICVGYATTLNIISILDNEGLSLLNGGLRLISRFCAFVTPSVVLGYFIGINRFEDMPYYYLGAGLALSALLNGALLYAGSELNYTGLSLTQSGFSPWPGLAVNLLAMTATAFIVNGLIRRINALTRARLQPEL